MPLNHFRFHGETQILDEAARASAPGQFIELTDGFTHYELTGPPDKTAVVLIHGFSVPYFLWDPTFATLNEVGFRVLRYDLLGRGYSDRPDAVYDQQLYERQLGELIDALNLAPSVDLVGLSMGGAIAVGFTARRPNRVRKLALIDPAGMPQPESLGVKLVRVPLLGEWLLNLFAERIIVAELAKDFYFLDNLDELATKYRGQMRYQGFRRALLSTLRHGPIGCMAAAYRQVGQQNRPVLLIWGRDDQTVPFAVSEQVKQAIPNLEFHPIDNTGHIPHYERPEVVNPLLIEFLISSHNVEGRKQEDSYASQHRPITNDGPRL